MSTMSYFRRPWLFGQWTTERIFRLYCSIFQQIRRLFHGQRRNILARLAFGLLWKFVVLLIKHNSYFNLFQYLIVYPSKPDNLPWSHSVSRFSIPFFRFFFEIFFNILLNGPIIAYLRKWNKHSENLEGYKAGKIMVSKIKTNRGLRYFYFRKFD